jgi:hypothetical protein
MNEELERCDNKQLYSNLRYCLRTLFTAAQGTYEKGLKHQNNWPPG